MEFFQVFSFLLIVYVFMRFLPRNGRLGASIPIIVVISFTAITNDITNSFIQLYNSSSILFFVQIIQCFSLAFAVESSLSSPPLKSGGAMEFSQLLDFLKILNHSIKLVPKNGKLMAFAATLSLLLPSILFSLFTFLHQHLVNRAISHQNILNYAPPLLSQIAFLLACSLIFRLFAIATIIVSAAAYRNKAVSLSDLFSRVKADWRRQLSNSFSRSRNPTRFELVTGAISNAVYVLAILNIIPSVLLIFFMDHASPLSVVVSVMEESSDGGHAQEKAGRLVEGQRVHGFIPKFLFLMALIYSLVLAEYTAFQIHLTRGLLLLNLLSLGRILWWILHVVLYFRCKKEKGEGIIDALGIGKSS